jgi:hypothetical protein
MRFLSMASLPWPNDKERPVLGPSPLRSTVHEIASAAVVLAGRISDLHLMAVAVGAGPDDGIYYLCQHGHAALSPSRVGPTSGRPGWSHRVAYV